MGISVLQRTYQTGDLRLHLSLRDGTFTDSGPWKFAPTTSDPPAQKTENGLGRFWSAAEMIEYADNDLFDFGLNGFSVAAWVRCTSASDFRPIMYHTAGGVGWYFLVNNATGRVRLGVAGGPVAEGTTNIVIGRWYFAAAVRNGDNVLIYVNGLWEATTGGHAALSATAAATLQVGRSTGAGTSMRGNMDELCIINGALSAWEIATLMAETKPRD